MYNGIKTTRMSAKIYTSIFCIRRFFLVCMLLILKDRAIWLIHTYNVIQSVYLAYISLTMPHTETIHNKLEYLNEICIISLQYTAVLFIYGSDMNPEVQWEIGKFIMSLVTFIFVVNFLTLIYLNVKRLQLWSKRKKAIRAMQ